MERTIATITGAGTGLCRSAAVCFAAEGASVTGCGRIASTGAETMRLIGEAGGTDMLVMGDVSRGEDVDRIVWTAIEQCGRLDIFVDNTAY